MKGSLRRFAGRFSDLIYRFRNNIAVSNRRYEKIVREIETAATGFQSLPADELADRAKQAFHSYRQDSTRENKARLMAVAREVAAVKLRMRPYDVQLVAALALTDRHCIEMQTGEGKTLAAGLAVCLLAAQHPHIHVLTFNDYLAERDANWMRPLFEAFGLSVGFVNQSRSKPERKRAYACDVTYVTAREAGFDYLRDQGCESKSDRVQQGHHFAIVDEADSILIDEARIPLVLAAAHELDSANLSRIADTIRRLNPRRDFQVLNNGRNSSFTDIGISHLESMLGCGPLYSDQNVELLARLNVALHAELLLHKNVDYIVRDNAIELIDEFTGRVAENRRWPGGIQAALEAKENLPIQPQGVILNSITMQYYLELYAGLAGMSGTAVESTGELHEFYDMKVVIIPPNRPCIRIDQTDRVFTDRTSKETALVDDIRAAHESGRPVLVGTASVEESARLAGQMRVAGISCSVLNAANDHEEAKIVAEAGALGAVTISTNMAGRGTDIKLGGFDERNREQVIELGGLYVIGTNRHESRRIDNQLRGRAGRQGDPGESRFYISADDDLLQRFGISGLLRNSIGRNSETENAAAASQQIAHVQRVIEGESFSIRKMLRKYAFLLERQRREISAQRETLFGDSFSASLLPEAAPELYADLVSKWGQPHIDQIERIVTLRHLDQFWSRHLEHATEMREGVHLVSLGGFSAFDTFNREINQALRSMRQQVAESVVLTFHHADITEDGIDLENIGLRAPSSTWTYMINDDPRGGVLDQLTRGVARLMRGLMKKHR